MISFGVTLQGYADQVPEDMAHWLADRQQQYPLIDFRIERFAAGDPGTSFTPALTEPYSRIFCLRKVTPAVQTVIFPYANEHWSVRLIGGVDSDGAILDPMVPDYNQRIVGGLPILLTRELAGLTPDLPLVKLADNVLGLPRTAAEPVLTQPVLTSVAVGDRLESAVSMSGAEYNELMSDPVYAERAAAAIFAKNWADLRTIYQEKFGKQPDGTARG